MATRPTDFLDWVTSGDGTKVVEPSLAKKGTGWLQAERPAFEHMNWLFYQTDQWIKYLDAVAVNESALTIEHIRMINGSWKFDALANTLQWANNPSGTNVSLLIPGVNDLFNRILANTVTISDGDILTVEANLPIYSQATTTNTSTTLNAVAFAEDLTVGMAVTGTGIVASPVTTITAISGSTVTISQAATSSATNTLTFSNDGFLTVTDSVGSNFVPTSSSVVIARRIGNLVYLGPHGEYTLHDGETRNLSNTDGFLGVLAVTSGDVFDPTSNPVPVYISKGGTDAVTLTTGITSGSPTATVSSATGLNIGDAVTGTGIAASTTISNIVGTTLTLSQNATATNASASVTYTRTSGRCYRLDTSYTWGPIRGKLAGFVTYFTKTVAAGDVINVVTDGMINYGSGSAGDRAYSDPTTVGGLTTTKPKRYSRAILEVISGPSTTDRMGRMITKILPGYSYSQDTGPILNTVTTNYTVAAEDDLVVCNSASALTVTLPSAATPKQVSIKNINTGVVTIARAGSDTIDEGTSLTINLQWDTFTLVSNGGTAWYKL